MACLDPLLTLTPFPRPECDYLFATYFILCSTWRFVLNRYFCRFFLRLIARLWVGERIYRNIGSRGNNFWNIVWISEEWRKTAMWAPHKSNVQHFAKGNVLKCVCVHKMCVCVHKMCTKIHNMCTMCAQNTVQKNEKWRMPAQVTPDLRNQAKGKCNNSPNEQYFFRMVKMAYCKTADSLA